MNYIKNTLFNKDKIMVLISLLTIISFTFLDVGTLFISVLGISYSAFLLKFYNIQSKNDLLNYRFVFSGGALGSCLALSFLNPLSGVFPLLVWIWNLYYSYLLIEKNKFKNDNLNNSKNIIKENNENETLNNLDYLKHNNIISDLDYNYLLSKIFLLKEDEKIFNKSVFTLKKLISLNNNNQTQDGKEYFYEIISNIILKIEKKDLDTSEKLKNNLKIFSLSI